MWWECTIRPDLYEILDYCNKNFQVVFIVTNWPMFSSLRYTKKILDRVNNLNLDILKYIWNGLDTKNILNNIKKESLFK